MTTTVQARAPKPAATKRVPMDSLRKTALTAGVIYLITFISIPTLALYGPVRNDPNYIVGPGPDTPVILGGVLEIIVALACIGTAVVLYPVVKRQNEGAALGFVGARVLEAAAIFAGVVSLLSVVTLRPHARDVKKVIAGVPTYRWRNGIVSFVAPSNRVARCRSTSPASTGATNAGILAKSYVPSASAITITSPRARAMPVRSARP